MSYNEKRQIDLGVLSSTYFLIQVPGLAENRPSVLRGDWLYVRLHEGDGLSQREYQGYVHEVRNESVILGFDKRYISLEID